MRGLWGFSAGLHCISQLFWTQTQIVSELAANWLVATINLYTVYWVAATVRPSVLVKLSFLSQLGASASALHESSHRTEARMPCLKSTRNVIVLRHNYNALLHASYFKWTVTDAVVLILSIKDFHSRSSKYPFLDRFIFCFMNAITNTSFILLYSKLKPQRWSVEYKQKRKPVQTRPHFASLKIPVEWIAKTAAT